MHLLDFWKERNRIACREGSITVQRLKNSFVYNLWSWNMMYLSEKAYSLLAFLGGWLQFEGW